MKLYIQTEFYTFKGPKRGSNWLRKIVIHVYIFFTFKE